MDHDEAGFLPNLWWCGRGRELAAVVGIIAIDRGTEAFQLPADIGRPERRARLSEQVLQIPHPPLQPSLAVTQVIVEDMRVLAGLGVPEQLTLPITRERRLCGELRKPSLILGGRVHRHDQGPASDRSIETRVIQDPL
jgi:hypothetical protein